MKEKKWDIKTVVYGIMYGLVLEKSWHSIVACK